MRLDDDDDDEVVAVMGQPSDSHAATATPAR